MTFRIEVDHQKCMGTSTCIYLAPGRFVLNEQGRSTPVQAETTDDPGIREAVEACPVQAIRLLDENGRPVLP